MLFWISIRGSRVRFPGGGAGNLSLHHRVQNDSMAHLASCPMGTRGLSLGIKRPVRETDHSPPSSAEVKNAWSYTSTPQYVLMTWCLVKHRNNFTFYEGVTKSFRTGLLEWELQMVQLSATRCSFIAILWVSLVSFVAIILCVASQRVFVVAVYFVIDSVRKLLDTSSVCSLNLRDSLPALITCVIYSCYRKNCGLPTVHDDIRAFLLWEGKATGVRITWF
jgi:hypothetical protein